MSDVNQLRQRIRDQFSSSQEKLARFQAQQVEMHHARQERLERLERLFEELGEVWRPRLEALAGEFGDRVQAVPTVTPARRQASFQVLSPLASIRLQFSAAANTDVTQLVVAYDLEIQPMLMQFERHAEISFPLESVDRQALAEWLDDRIVEFVKTYLLLHENEYYLKDQMVDDPIARVRFPRFAAGATRQREGKTYYFISEETAGEFDRQN